MGTNSNIEGEEISALRWHLEMGADEVVEETPVDRLKESPEKPLPEKGSLEKKPEKKTSTPPPSRTAAPRQVNLAQTPGKAEAMAEEVAAKAETLDELKSIIEQFEGCSLKKTAMNTVFCDGNPESGLMLVGEAPGADEDRQGKPFVGASGRLLDKMMGAIGLTREKDYYISNILPWRPPGNRKPTPVESATCLPFIKRHIALAKPKILVFLGGTAVTALLGITDGITRTRGRWYKYKTNGDDIAAFPIFHPAYLLRQPQLKGKAWQDLQEIRKKLDG